MKMKNVNIISLQDFDELVKKTYGKIYSFQQQDGCKDRQTVYFSVPYEDAEDFKNDKIPEIINGDKMGVSFKSWLEKNPESPLNPNPDELKECIYYWGEDVNEWCSSKSHIELFWDRNFYPHVSMIVNDLHAKGLLPAGEYGIEIDW